MSLLARVSTQFQAVLEKARTAISRLRRSERQQPGDAGVASSVIESDAPPVKPELAPGSLPPVVAPSEVQPKEPPEDHNEAAHAFNTSPMPETVSVSAQPLETPTGVTKTSEDSIPPERLVDENKNKAEFDETPFIELAAEQPVSAVRAAETVEKEVPTRSLASADDQFVEQPRLVESEPIPSVPTMAAPIEKIVVAEPPPILQLEEAEAAPRPEGASPTVELEPAHGPTTPMWENFQPGVASVPAPTAMGLSLGRLWEALRPKVRPPCSDYQRELYEACTSSLEKRFVALLTDVFGDERVRAWQLMPQGSFSFFDGRRDQPAQVDFVMLQGEQVVAIELDGDRYHDPLQTNLWYLPATHEHYRNSYHYQVLRQNGLMLRSHRVLRWCGRHFDKPGTMSKDVEMLLAKVPSRTIEYTAHKIVASHEARRCRCLEQAGGSEGILLNALERALGRTWLPFLHFGSCPTLLPLGMVITLPSIVLLTAERPVGFMVDKPGRYHERWYAELLDIQNVQIWYGWVILRFVEAALTQAPDDLDALLTSYANHMRRPVGQTPVAPLIPLSPLSNDPIEMALAHLSTGRIGAFNAWRAEEKHEPLNLFRANMSGYQLMGADFRGCLLVGADFRDADLRNADMSGANLAYVDFSGAALSGTRFNGADITLAKWGDEPLAHIQADWPTNRFLLPHEAVSVEAPAAVSLGSKRHWAFAVTIINRGDVPAQVTLTLQSNDVDIRQLTRVLAAGSSTTESFNGHRLPEAKSQFQLHVVHSTLAGDIRRQATIQVNEGSQGSAQAEVLIFAATSSSPSTTPAGQTSEEWVDILLCSEVFRERQTLAGPRSPDSETIRQVLRLMQTHEGTISIRAFAKALNMPEIRIPGFLSALQRLINVDGYEALRFDDSSKTLHLDAVLLRRQFDLV